MPSITARLYDTDFYGWIQQQLEVMRAGNLADLDLDNLIEEVESMGKSQKRELRARLEVLFMHLLKWRHQPQKITPSWRYTIEEQRVRIGDHLKENPSLKSQLSVCVKDAYGHAKRLAARETGLEQSVFPVQCPWTFEQIMDADFWPDSPPPG